MNTVPTKPVVDELVERVAAGGPPLVAAAAAGIDEDTFAGWMRRGTAERDRRRDGIVDESESVFVDVVSAVEKASAVAELRLVDQICRAADEPRGWQAAAWLLEHGRADRWSKGPRAEHVPADADSDDVAAVVKMRRVRRERPTG